MVVQPSHGQIGARRRLVSIQICFSVCMEQVEGFVVVGHLGFRELFGFGFFTIVLVFLVFFFLSVCTPQRLHSWTDWSALQPAKHDDVILQITMTGGIIRTKVVRQCNGGPLFNK